MLVGSTCFLLVARVQGEGESLSTLLVVCRLRDLLPQVEVRIVILLDAGRGGGAWLDYNRVHVLNGRNLYLLLTVFARGAASTHRLRWAGTVATTAATHECGVVAKLETFIHLS